MKVLFREVNYHLSKLLAEIDDGELALPEIQRPFVWSRTKVRDLFDSMYRGFPVGFFLFWENPAEGGRQIGLGEKQHAPRRLIVDGQQRLTSLYSVIRGQPIVDDDYRESQLRIAFRPRDGRFDVPDAAIERDPEYIANIADLWAGELSRNRFQKAFIERLQGSRDVPDDEEDQLIESIDRLYDLKEYPFTALELAANAQEDQVADVFVRINSEGVELRQADFILTLMSVYWEKGRRELEDFSRATRLPNATGPTPFNHFIRPSPDLMLRVTVGLGLRRGVLKAVYPVLRGKEIDTGAVSPEVRDHQFALLRDAQEHVLDLTNWHEFLKSLQQAGYRSGSMITSGFNVLFSYIAFLIGRRDHGMDYVRLRSLIARWFAMASITSRYTGSSESRLEADLRRFSEASSGDEFEQTLDQIIATQLTGDFWEVGLPDALNSSASYSPVLFAYWASLNILGAKVLFSTLTVPELLDPAIQSKKKALDRHHLFPRKYLESTGIKGVTRVNQIANYAFLEWPDNIAILDKPPSEYFPKLWEQRVSPADRDTMRFLHALPEGWENLSYEDFLEKRRPMIAKVTRAGFEKLSTGHVDLSGAKPPAPPGPSVADLLKSDENSAVEFKSSAAVSHQNADVPEKVINDQIVKSVAAFLNSDGGALGIGIADNKDIVGIEADLDFKKMDLDRYTNWLTSLLIAACGAGPVTACTSIRPEATDKGTVVIVDVRPAPRPIFVKTSKSDEVFYVRANNTTRQLPMSEAHHYIKERWA